MTPARTHLVSILESSREALVRESTDVAFAAGDVPISRPDVEQMIRACVALLEEKLRGESRDVRTGFLEALPDVARTTTWELTLKHGLPCWGVLVAKLVAAAAPQFRDEATSFLSQFMGEWWSDVSKVMLPVFIKEGTL